MDYGKLAYLKAIDLEMRKFKGENVNICYLTLRNISPGEREVTEITGKGDAAVFINCSDEAAFYVNGTEVCKGKNVFFRVKGGGKITLKSDFDVRKLDFMAIGDIDDYKRSSRAYVDYANDKIGYVLCENGRAEAFVSSLPMLVPSKMVFDAIDEFTQGDVCASDDGFIWAFVGQGRLSTFRGNECYYYNVKAEKVAINYDYVLTIAYIDDGVLHYIIGEFARPMSSGKVKFNGKIDDVRFVKKGSGLLFSSGGKCYIKELNKDIKTSGVLCVELKAELL